MTILQYYIEKQKNTSWYKNFQSIGESAHGKLFTFINTNFRTLSSFLEQLNRFRSKDGLRRIDWGTMDCGQEEDKHRVVNLKNADFISFDGDRYHITEKGHEALRIYDSNELTKREKWILLLMLIINYKTEKRDFDLIKAVLGLSESLSVFRIKRIELIQKLSKSCHILTKNELFESDIFWLITFYTENEFLKIFINSTEEEKNELKKYLIKCSTDKKSKDCLAHKYVSSGAYSVKSFGEDINISLCVLVIAALQDKTWEAFLSIICKFYPSANHGKILDFMAKNRSIYDEVYKNTFAIFYKE
ncbi:hypothetical protein [Treponema sp.]|uniref:hypothetical protein n=1 Tax=Treponema sp. TaxID=166 RepID=UPI003FD8CC10